MALQPNQTLPTPFIKQWAVLSTQTSTNPPTLQPIQDTIGVGTVTPTYVSAGVYRLTFETPIPNATKSVTKLSNNLTNTAGDGVLIQNELTGDTITSLLIRTYSNGTPTDAKLLNTEIKVQTYNI